MVNKTSDALSSLRSLDRDTHRASPANDDRSGVCLIAFGRVTYCPPQP